DRRGLRIRLTRQGKRLAKKVFDQHGRWIAALFGNLSIAERRQLATLLAKVSARVASDPAAIAGGATGAAGVGAGGRVGVGVGVGVAG
ncbi:MAG: hypothetical protein AB7I42_30485, partial [Bradyrhizobium sp.]